jgi:hypothetical protein
MRRRHHLDDDDDIADTDIIADGGSVRVPLYLCDSVQRAVLDAYGRRTGYARLTDAAQVKMRREARDTMIKRAENAWRLDARRKKNRDDDDDDDDDYNETDPDKIGQSALSVRTDARSISDARAAATASYHQMCARLRDAWRMQDAPQPDNSSSSAEWRRHMASVPDPGDPKVRRDKAYQDYTTNLSNAWMQGRTDPSRADEVEERLERERGRFA